ncbi:PQQ-binding-like beta-propeller repeat protein [Paenibacillus sinopodophylli]|uniref:outer membrane protein assembly factor BamB family protein n=1 Tax=Paenibacillus sinopodophylli TaxID=1837342 RepID=UPI001486B095|nr:PQQ-binding-like beta-propeller repeat protein [Paenibacillus sinopodophylli]
MAERWALNVEGGVGAEPVIGADGTMYVLTKIGKLYAISPAGKVIWTATVSPMSKEYTNEKGKVLLGNDGVIYVSSGGNLHAIQADGTVKWVYETTYPRFDKVELQRNGLIYILNFQSLHAIRLDGTKAFEKKNITGLLKYKGISEDKIYLTSLEISAKNVGDKYVPSFTTYAEELNTNGSTRWKLNLNNTISYTNPSVDVDGNMLVFIQPSEISRDSKMPYYVQSRQPSEVKVINEGTVRRNYSLSGSTTAPILFDEQRNAYVVTRDAVVSKFDSSGKLIWKNQLDERTDLNENGMVLHLEQDGTLLFYSRLYRYESVNASSDQSELHKLELHRFSPDGKLISSTVRKYDDPVVWLDNGMVLYDGYNKLILSDSEMKTVREFDASSFFHLTYIDQKQIYIGTNSGRVIALELRSITNEREVVSLSFGNIITQFQVGTNSTLQASVKYADGKEQLNPSGVIYRTSNEKIAYFDKSVFHAVAPGEVEVTAEYLNVKTTIKVEVNERPNTEKAKIKYSAMLYKKWSYVLPTLEVSKNESYLAPVLSEDGSIYALSSQGKIAAVSSDGKIQWQHNLNQQISKKPLLGPDARLYIGTNSGRLISYDLISGDQLHNENIASGYSSKLLGWDRTGNRYTGFSMSTSSRTVRGESSKLQAVSTADALRWTTSLVGEITHDEPVLNINGDTLYVVTKNSEAVGEVSSNPTGMISLRFLGTLYAINASSGHIRWKYDLGNANSMFYKPLLLQDGTIAVASSEGILSAVDMEGKLKWKNNFKIYSQSAPFISKNKLVIVKQNIAGGITEEENDVQLFNMKDYPVAINQRQNEWLFTLKENAIAAKSRHSIASYDTAGKQKWRIDLTGDKSSVSSMTNDLQVAVIDNGNELSLFDIEVTRSSENLFHDMKVHWAREAVEKLVETEVVSGFPDGTYRPNAAVTREQFLTMLTKQLDTTLRETELSFSDVPKTRWSRAVIESAVADGWIDTAAYGGTFKPNDPVTREEMAVWTAKALKLTEKSDGLDKVSDRSSIKSLNRGLVGAVIDAGIINGYEDGSFKPMATLTRAEAAILLSRLIR